MNYTINEEQHKMISKQLKEVETIVRHKKNLLAMTKLTQIPAYWEKRNVKIKAFAREANEIKLVLRNKHNENPVYTINDEEMEKIIKSLEAGFSLCKFLVGDVRSLKKTIKNVIDVIEHEVTSHHLEHIISYKITSIDAILENVETVMFEHPTTMDEIKKIKGA